MPFSGYFPFLASDDIVVEPPRGRPDGRRRRTTLTMLWRMLADRYEDQPFWTPEEARRAINEAMKIWNLVTGTWTDYLRIRTIPDDPYLFVGGAFTKVTRVSMNDRELIPTSVRALDLAMPNWRNLNTAAGEDVPTTPRYWAPLSLTTIMIYPQDAPPGQHLIDIEGVVRAPILFQAEDYIDIGEEDIPTLIGYALHILSFAKGATALLRTKHYLVEFFQAAAEKSATFAASSFYRKMIGQNRSRYARPVDAPLTDTALSLVQSVGDR